MMQFQSNKLINLLTNSRSTKLENWINKINNYTDYNRLNEYKKNQNLYTIWLMTTPFSESLPHTLQNLNYLGYNYKILLNDNQVSAFKYMIQNTNTRYFIKFDDDFIIMKNSIEYMLQVKQKISYPVVIFRLYDLNFGQYNFNSDIPIYTRYGIKINDTLFCKKVFKDMSNDLHSNDIGDDYFYKSIGKTNYLNYKDWENNGHVVGYHQLYCSNYSIFLLYLKISARFKQYNQDSKIIYEYFSKFTKDYKLLIMFLQDFNNKINLNINKELIKNCLDSTIFENTKCILSYNKLLTKNIADIYHELTNEDYNKIAGFIIGLDTMFDYNYSSYIKIKNLYEKLNLNKTKKTRNILYILNDINHVYKKSVDYYKQLKKEYDIVKVYSITPLVSVCNHIDIYDLINFVDIVSLNKFAEKNNFDIIYEVN